MNRYNVIIPAAGLSTRFKQQDKLLLKINNEFVIKHSLSLFLDDENCSKIILATSNKNFNEFKKMFCCYPKVLLIKGCETRFLTVQKSSQYLDKTNQFVLIHDAARPFLNIELLNQIKQNIFSNNFDCVISIKNIYESIISVHNNLQYLNRDNIKLIQTPQAFKQKVLLSAYLKNKQTDFNDEFSFVLDTFNDCKYKLVESNFKNTKITVIEDI